MPPVRWEQISSSQAEDVISMLLNLLYPDRAERIDGSGGDGGRDVQVRLDDGLHVFQIKSFTGRVTPNRRSQILHSLRTATELNPIDWTLLVPIDPTPGEHQWFERLGHAYSFPMKWLGRTWLDTEMAARPMIQRYFLADAAQEVRQLLELARQEEAGLARGALDAVERVGRIAAQLNEQDPFYRWEVRSDGSSSSVSPSPRYSGAQLDRPLTIHFEFEFTADPEGQAVKDELERSIDFGTAAAIPHQFVRSVAIDAPVFPKGQLPGGRVEIQPIQSGPPIEVLLALTAPDGATLAELGVVSTSKTSGQRGAILEATDATGFLWIELTADLVDRRMGIRIKVERSGPFYPTQFRALLAFITRLTAPNTIEVREASGAVTAGGPIEESDPMAGVGYLRLIDDLILVQWATGRYERVGPELSEEDLGAIWAGSQLLRGQPRVGTWNFFTLDVRDDASDKARRLLAKDGFRLAAETTEPFAVAIGGTEYALGQGTVTELDSATMAPEHDDLADRRTTPRFARAFRAEGFERVPNLAGH